MLAIEHVWVDLRFICACIIIVVLQYASHVPQWLVLCNQFVCPWPGTAFIIRLATLSVIIYTHLIADNLHVKILVAKQLQMSVVWHYTYIHMQSTSHGFSVPGESWCLHLSLWCHKIVCQSIKRPIPKHPTRYQWSVTVTASLYISVHLEHSIGQNILRLYLGKLYHTYWFKGLWSTCGVVVCSEMIILPCTCVQSELQTTVVYTVNPLCKDTPGMSSIRSQLHE
jgi:hypothetical protein